MNREIILVATDLSARSDRAIDRALQLGQEMGRRVEVLHVAEPKAALADDQSDRLHHEILGALPAPDVECDILVKYGSAPQTIASAATDRFAAMIVTGVARFNSVGDYVLGTAVDTIIRHSRVPVLIVKHRPHQPYRRILCATDLSDHSAHALCTALELFPNCEVVAIHAYHVPYESWNKAAYVREEIAADARAKLDAFIAKLPLSDDSRQRLKHRTGYGDVGEVVNQEIETENPDLVVFCTHGMGGFRQATIGSIASSMLQWVVRDVLIIPPK